MTLPSMPVILALVGVVNTLQLFILADLRVRVARLEDRYIKK